MIHTVNDNKIIAFDWDREPGKRIIAVAARKNPGTVWNIWYNDHRKTTTRNETVHARVSGKLPADVQRRMVVNLLDIADH